MSQGTITLKTESVDYNSGGPYTRGAVLLENVIGWEVDENTSNIRFWHISTSDNVGGTWGICYGSGPYYIKLEPQVSYDGGNTWTTLQTAQHLVDTPCGGGWQTYTNTVAMSTSLINSLSGQSWHLSNNCSLRFLYYMTVAPAPSAGNPNAFPNESYSEVSQIPVVVEVDWVSTLNYNANGGSGAPAAQTHTNSASTSQYSQTISTTIPVRSGYEFLGWADSSSATTAQYQPGGSYVIYKTNANKTIYAVWRALYDYSITYNANGGTPTPATQTYTGPETSHTFTVTSTTVTRTNYRFEGWRYNGTTYQPGASITLQSGTPAITMTAVWTEYYRPGERRVSGAWSSHNRSGGACERKVSGTWTEMRTIDGGVGTGDEPTRKSSGTWYNQRKCGQE